MWVPIATWHCCQKQAFFGAVWVSWRCLNENATIPSLLPKWTAYFHFPFVPEMIWGMPILVKCRVFEASDELRIVVPFIHSRHLKFLTSFSHGNLTVSPPNPTAHGDRIQTISKRAQGTRTLLCHPNPANIKGITNHRCPFVEALFPA